jgi:hypothetical protein
MKRLLALICLMVSSLLAQDFDRYGGTKAIQGKTTGWFHLEEVGGRWFFITPEGNAFIPVGVNHVGTYLNGANKLRPTERDFVKEKHNGSQREASAHAEKLVRSWGFNYAGYDAPLHLQQSMPFSTGFKQTKTSGVTVFGPPEYVDVFAPEFAADLDQRVAAHCLPQRENRFLLGHYLVDLPRWGDTAYLENEEKKQGASWLSFFRKLPPGSPGGLAYAKAIRGASDLKAAELAFTAEIADQCYRLTAEAFRRHDPNHLVLGERFAGSRIFMPVVERSAKYFPVVATQLEGDFDTAFYLELHQRTGRPVINADHVAGFLTAGTPKVLGRALKDEAEAAAQYTRYLRAAFAEPYFIGYNRCQLASRIFQDGMPPGWKQGILDPAGEPYPLLLNAITTTNREVLRRLYRPQ